MENHHFYTWPFSIAMLNYQRVSAVSSSSHRRTPQTTMALSSLLNDKSLARFRTKPLVAKGGADGPIAKKAIPVEFVWV